MYQVIARKYRPQSFREVVGQEHVKTTLEHAIAQNRIAHGYIFSGQRGTGKTTVARILARCLNCVNGPTAEPCGECASCREISAGGSVDVIEIDAASNRGINEMRELRENVRYQPARDRYKVFIVDEAHQITSEAFNALLKTIEEPPPWVVFVLCTTEAHKIPATIASRCQHFSFRSVNFEDLVARMEWICAQEKIETDADALAVLAQAGEGSVRDSLSALDQAIACCAGKLQADEVRALLGAFSLDALAEVARALLEADSARMLQIVDELERNGHNLQHFSRELSRWFRNLLVARIAGADTRLIAASPAEREKMAGIAAQFSEEDLTRYLQLSLDLFRDLQFSLQPRFHLEIGLVRLVHAGKLLPIEEALASLPKGRMETGPARPQGPAPPPPPPPPARSAPSPFEQDRARKAARPPGPQTGGTAAAPALESRPPSAPQATVGAIDWREKLHGVLMEMGMAFSADAVEHSVVVERDGELQFTVPEDFSLGIGPDDPNIGKAVRQIAGRPLRIKVAIGETGPLPETAPPPPAKQPGQPDERALSHPEVQRFRELFGGEVRDIRSLKE
jgi:DNA polymerase III subunit gamma/tau